MVSLHQAVAPVPLSYCDSGGTVCGCSSYTIAAAAPGDTQQSVGRMFHHHQLQLGLPSTTGWRAKLKAPQAGSPFIAAAAAAPSQLYNQVAPFLLEEVVALLVCCVLCVCI